MLRIRRLAFVTSALLIASAGAASAVVSPLSTIPQQEADRPVRVPSTAYCTETIMDQHTFANSYYAPYTGTYTPPVNCPGPWNKVVLTFSATTTDGAQYDRTLDVSLGGAELLRSSTSEPCCTGDNAVSWSVQRDVTADQALFTGDQPVLVRLDNIDDPTQSGYDAAYITTATLTFYETGPGAPAPAYATVVDPISPQAPHPTSGNTAIDSEFTLNSTTPSAGNTVTFPQNLTGLTAELFADGHGSDEEFWWDEPQQSGSATATPYREVAVSIDGQLAGAAPVFPTVFTGGEGPGFWEPIPSPRAWNLRPYDVDLTPFVGTLTDGQPHRIALSVLDADYSDGGDGYWPVAANLLGTVSSSPARTTGALTSAVAPAAVTDVATTDPVGLTYQDKASHALSFAGYTVDGNGQRVDTVVDESTSMTGLEPSAGADDSWMWTRSSARTTGGHTTTTAGKATFSLLNTIESRFQFTDDDALTTTVDGAQTFASTTKENMGTTGVGLAQGVEETEDYGYSDSTGVCYHHTLTALGGQVEGDTTDGNCPNATLGEAYNDPDGSPYPAAAPAAALPEGLPLGLAAAGLLAGGFAVRRRRA